MITNNAEEVVVVGGGVAGLATAFYLVEAGEDVCLVEEGAVGKGASWAGGGILSPLKPWKYSEWHEDLTKFSLKCLQELTQRLKERQWEFERNETGLFYANEALDSSIYQWSKRVPSSRVLQGSELLTWLQAHSFSKAFVDTVKTGIWMPEVANIRNPRFLQALKSYLLQSPRFRLMEQTKADLVFGVTHCKRYGVLGVELCSQSGKGAGGKEFLPSRTVVITAGAWSTTLFRDSGGPQIKPIRGEMLLFKPKAVLETMVMEGDHYLIPRADGLVLAGSTTDEVGFVCETTAAGRETLQTFAGRILPELQALRPLKHWAGLRPALVGAEGNPYVGPVKGILGLWVNTGHYRNGIVHGPGAAKLLVDQIQNLQPAMPSSPTRQYPASSNGT